MRTPRPLWILGLAVLALVFTLREQRAFQSRRERLERTRLEMLNLESQIAAEHASQRALQDELDATLAANGAARANLARAEAQRAASDPEFRWAIPPATLPEWTPESPYVWIEKGTLKAIPMEPFTASGQLHPWLPDVLAIEPESVRNLTSILDRHLQDLRALEAEQVVVSQEAAEPAPNGDGRPVSILVTLPYVDASPIRSALESDLRRELGDPRADLVLHWGQAWLNEQFGDPAQTPRTYRVTRASDGTFAIETRTARGSSSMNNIPDFTLFLPEHLRASFSPLNPADP